MKAIIVPGVTDLNKGDQALVWESHRLVVDTSLFEEVCILSNGDTQEEREKLCLQSEQRGYKIIENILKHPRRGKHNNDEAVKESLYSFIRLVLIASKDYLTRSFLLFICNNQKLVDIFFGKEVSDTIRYFKKCDVIFIKGGGFIHAYGERTAPYLIWFFLYYPKLGLKMKKKVIFLPNSYGPFIGLAVSKQIKSVLDKIDKIYAREELSSVKLQELLNAKIDVSPDLGFYLKKAEDNLAISLLEKYGFNNEDKIIGITIRPWRFPGKNNPEVLYEKYISSIVRLSEYLVNKGYKVAFCNQSIGPNSHEDDRNAIKEVFTRSKASNLIWIDENLPCDQLKDLYSNFYIFIGTRFHSVIFSLTSLVPSLAIGYGGNKAKGIMADFNLKEYTIAIEDVTADDLIYMFDNLVLNYFQIKAELKSNIELLNEKRDQIIRDVSEIIKR